MKILVLPSIRENSLRKFFEAWKVYGDWDHVVIIEDNPKKTFDLSLIKKYCIIKSTYHFAWDDVQSSLGNNSWTISKRDSAIRCFGFYLCQNFPKDSYFLTLDDDCYPYEDKPIFQSHIEKMCSHSKWIP